MSTTDIATTPNSSHRPGMRRCSAAPTVRQASAVTTPVPTWPPWPVAHTASPPATAASGSTRSRARTTSSTAMTASSGVVIAAASTVDGASPGATSSPNVPTMIDIGSSAAHAGARSRASRGKGLARGRRTRAPSRTEAGTPESALCKLKLTITIRSCVRVVNEHAGPPHPRAMRPPEGTKWISQIAAGGPRSSSRRAIDSARRCLLKFPTSIGPKPQGFLKIRDSDHPGSSDGSSRARIIAAWRSATPPPRTGPPSGRSCTRSSPPARRTPMTGR